MQYGDVLILNKTRRSFALFSLAQTSLKNNDLIHQDNNLLLGETA